eukprot:1489727-Amphidinium_carterae.1
MQSCRLFLDKFWSYVFQCLNPQPRVVSSIRRRILVVAELVGNILSSVWIEMRVKKLNMTSLGTLTP